MKAEELMMGDWVNVFCDIYIKAKVTKEDFGNPTFFPRTKPIPITPEILEKNGFRVEEYDGSFFVDVTDRRKFSWKDKHDWTASCEICTTPDGFYFEVENLNRDIVLKGYSLFFVHELQHALRLCGIDKEIVL